MPNRSNANENKRQEDCLKAEAKMNSNALKIHYNNGYREERLIALLVMIK